MRVRSLFLRATVIGFVGLAAWSQVSAEDVDKKWRLGLNLGGLNAQDEIESDSANVLNLVDREFMFIDQFIDPRDDGAVFGRLEIRPAALATLSAQYAVNKIFMVELSVGYQKTEVGQVELQAQFDQIPIDDDINFNFGTFRIEAGDLERIPLQVAGLARFRPRAAFNPYVGGGIGYSIIGFEPSEAFNELSRNLDNSAGQGTILSSAIIGAPNLTALGETVDLEGARVDARDTWEWFVAMGMEYTFKPKWALLLDFRYSLSGRSIDIGFNGEDDLGEAVPFLTDFSDGASAQQAYGAVRITEGGLVDGGSLMPLVTAPVGTDCDTDPQFCFFDNTQLDGEVDKGFYYIQGGSVKYDAFSFQAGIRFTF